MNNKTFNPSKILQECPGNKHAKRIKKCNNQIMKINMDEKYTCSFICVENINNIIWHAESIQVLRYTSLMQALRFF